MRKACSSCMEEKELSEFHKEKRNKSGVGSICRACKKVADKDYKLRSTHGISYDKYVEMVEERDNLCDVCGESPVGRGKNDQLIVEHNHDTGDIRGLTCGLCNAMLGMSGDSAARLLAGAKYLMERGSYESIV